MNSKNTGKDPVLERIINETAQELGINVDMIWKVYNHCYTTVFTRMTEDNLQYLSREEKIKRARNVQVPGLGKFIHIFGKTFKTRGVKEIKKSLK